MTAGIARTKIFTKIYLDNQGESAFYIEMACEKKSYEKCDLLHCYFTKNRCVLQAASDPKEHTTNKLELV